MHVNIQIQQKMGQLRVKELQQEQNHHCSLRNFDEQLNEALQEAEDYENQTKNIHKILDLIKTGLARLGLSKLLGNLHIFQTVKAVSSCSFCQISMI